MLSPKLSTFKNMMGSIVLVGLSSGSVFATETPVKYTLNTDLSQLNLITIKKQYILETATIKNLSGSITDNGEAEIIAPIKEIDTGVPTRNARLNELFFESQKYPNITITANIDEYKLGSTESMERRLIGFDVELYGQTKRFNTDVFVSKVDHQLLVSSITPIIVSSDDFNIPALNLVNLAKTVGEIPISNTVPVSFNIVFDIATPSP